MERWQAHREEMEKAVVIDEKGVMLHGYYWITRDRIDTHEKLVGWLHHLLEKRWFTADHAYELISKVGSEYGIKVNLP